MGDAPGPTRAESLMIGRQVELVRVLEVFEAVESGHGRVVMLSGEPGIGKTRLGREVLARASTSKARTSVGRSFEQHSAVPFFPFTEALTLSPVGSPLLPEPAALERWPELAHLVPEIDTSQQRPGGDEVQLRIFRAVTAFLRQQAEVSPLVFLLDDLHWADTTSLSLLLYLGRHLEGSRILLLGAYRDAEVDRGHAFVETLRELERERLMDELHVRPLSLDGTAGLIRQHLASQLVSDELVALVHARAQGNPFFIEELLKALVEQGGLSEGEERWAHRAVSRLDVPRSLRSLVAHRVARLPAETRELLRLASVVGQEVELGVLVMASGQPERTVLDDLDTALAAGLLKEVRDGHRHCYAFVHALVQQALYAGLPRSLCRRLHQRIGEALEVLRAGHAASAAELARHFLAAGDAERAVVHALGAGREASARYAHAEAARWYQEAVDLLLERGKRSQAAEAQYCLASEMYDLNHLAEALAVYQAALDTFEQ